MNIISKFNIQQVDERVFQIGNFSNIDIDFKNVIVSILNKGSKFVPALYTSPFTLVKNFISNFDSELNKLNSKIFLQKMRLNNNTSNVILNSSNLSDDPYSSFLNKSHKSSLSSNLLIEKEALDLKYEIYNQLSKIFFDFKNNLSAPQISALRNFSRHKQFKIVEADKNIGIVILTHNTYNDLAIEHLSDRNIYEELNNISIAQINSEIKSKLLKLFKDNHINSQRILNNLFVRNDLVKFGRFRLMPKLHKSKFGIRPIINCENHPTARISLLIDCLLKPIVYKTESFIQDSQNLIQKIGSRKFPSNCRLYSCDFESLYTNIKLQDALNVICDYVKDKLDFSDINMFAFRKLLEILFNYNYFIYKNLIFRQKFGIAMGTIAAPNIANIFVYCFEKSFLFIYRPLFYCRYIDDIFIILDFNFDINILINSFSSLTLNVVSDEVVNFLNLNIRLCKLTGSLIFSIYYKPTNTFSYLLNSSNHPSHIFDNIPFGLFYNAKRICSDFHDFLFHSRKIFSNLLNRGFDSKKLLMTSNVISKLNRNDLIPYRNRSTKNLSTENCFIFKIPFDINLNNKHIDIRQSFKKIISNSVLLKDFKLKLIYSRQLSILDIFINHFKQPIFKFHYKKCKNKFCLICYFANSGECIFLNNFPLIAKNNFSCNSTNCVYVIICKKCPNTFYVGQTINLHRRITNHLRDISNFSPYKIYTSVSTHFNLVGHDIFKHFSFFVIKSLCIEKDKLLVNNENFFINLFNLLDINIYNEIIPDLKYLFKYKIDEIG